MEYNTGTLPRLLSSMVSTSSLSLKSLDASALRTRMILLLSAVRYNLLVIGEVCLLAFRPGEEIPADCPVIIALLKVMMVEPAAVEFLTKKPCIGDTVVPATVDTSSPSALNITAS